MKPIQKIIDLLKKHNSFALFSHVSPDCDAFGSCSALKIALERMGKTVYFYSDGDVPKNLQFLDIRLEQDPVHISEVEVCILIDCNNISVDRLGRYCKYVANAPIVACIDHHQRNNEKFTCKFIDSKSPSACDIIYRILKLLKVKIDKEIATFLYSGSATDTASFINTNTNANCHKV